MTLVLPRDLPFRDVQRALVGVGFHRETATGGDEPRLAGFVRPGRSARLGEGRIVAVYNPGNGLRLLQLLGDAEAHADALRAVLPVVDDAVLAAATDARWVAAVRAALAAG